MSASIDATAVRFGSASTLATTGMRGSLRRQRAQERREAIFRRLHQRAVEWRADGQRNDALGARGFRELARRARRHRHARQSRPDPGH